MEHNYEKPMNYHYYKIMISNEDTRGFLLRCLVKESSIPPEEKKKNPWTTTTTRRNEEYINKLTLV